MATTPRTNPSSIHLEAMGACQLRCPSCPTADGSIRPAIASGYLRFERFRQLLDDNPQVRAIELSNYGEIFLNPQLLDILRYAHVRGVALTAANGVNLNTVKPELLEGVVKYQLRAMTCSIDGASKETYPIYRVKGDFDTVLANVRAIVEFKRRYRSPYPVLTWQFIVFGHNEHELPAARRLAEELGMIFKPKISWDDTFSPIKDRAFVMREAGIHATRDEFAQATHVDYARPTCHQLWNEPQVNWDGKILGCCRNFWGDFGGNAFDDGLVPALNNPKIAYARRMLMGQEPARGDVPCATCDVYQRMVTDGRFITTSELRWHTFWTRLNGFARRQPRLYGVAREIYRRTGARRLLRPWLR
ncbi:MAG: radical SAM/SPASM domain-containing protein [Proteobacteria bacterium]|nr:radical SAM/SPASM domain-containing protein [Pseudomonadota bacterium]